MATEARTLSVEEKAEFATELDRIRSTVIDSLGAADVDHLRRVVRAANISGAAGRGLLHFGFGPVTFVAGVAALASAKILENMEIGHNVMHGQYDWTGIPEFQGQTYEWDNVCDGANWRHFHNFEHHTYTNVLGLDRDIGYEVLRVTPEQPWEPHHLAQPLHALALALLFQWGVAVHDLRFEVYTSGERPWSELRDRARPFLKKAGWQLFKDYVFFPAIALANAPRVLLGNLIANGIRNVWSFAIIFCGHFPEGVRVYTREETEDESRGDWYLRQLAGSANLEGGRLFHIMSGHLSHQIEHHMFPDIPAARYPEIAPAVRELCERYGQPYNTGGFFKQFGSVIGRILRFALPDSWTRSAAPSLAPDAV
jgi:linoleoyl-CoA desaturase